MKKFTKIMLFVVMALMVASCGPAQQQTDQGFNIDQKFDPEIYHLTLQLDDDPGNYSQTHGSISGTMISGYGSMSGAIWQDGKGLVRGEIVELTPVVDFASVGDTIVAKTTDWKVMALWPGDTVHLVCTVDYEPVCSVEPISEIENKLIGCYDIWEFDYCRLNKIEPPIPID